MDKNWELLRKRAEEFNISINSAQIEQFKLYWQFLDTYNKHTNLVSRTDPEIIIKKHFIDSLSIGLLKDEIKWNNPNSIIDIGIGGGFPGIPIILINQSWKLCAVDSVGKKTKFIELLAKELGIPDRVETITARAEDLAQDMSKREQFDIVVSRAVSQLNILSEYCLPFIKKSGYFIAYKAKTAEQELKEANKAIKLLGGEVRGIFPYELPNEEGERNLILIKKNNKTPSLYPRKAGIPRKKPII